MSEDLERVREGDTEKASEDAIERKRDVEATTEDFEGHRHVAATTEKNIEKFTEKHVD
jgi:hypothetical protein